MARIPDAELARIKSTTDLVTLVGSSGVALSPRGRDWVGRCPWHDDREPSLVVSPAKGLWQCLGACQVGGSAIDWVMRVDGVGFREAVARLQGAPQREASPTPPMATIPEPRRRDLLGQVADAYAAAYRPSEAAQEYAASRGIAAAAEPFGFGFADRSLTQALGLGQDAESRVVRDELKAIGVLKATGYEHFAGCLVVPIRDESGSVVSLYGRRVRDGKGPRHLYLPGPRQGVLNGGGLEPSVILCESIVDALTFWVEGFQSVTCTWGTHGLTDAHLEAFRRHGVERVAIAFDRDEAGDRGARKVAEQLDAVGIASARVLLPKGLDVNEYAQKVQPARKALQTALESAWPRPKAPAEPAPEPPAVSFDATQPFERRFGDRHYRVRGLARNLSYERLKVVIRAARGEAFFVDGVDLVSSKQRQTFLHQVAEELKVEARVVKKDLAKLHFALEEAQEALIERTLEPEGDTVPPMSEAEREEALALLRDPALLDRILEAFDACGVVGETTNKLVGYLGAVSRKLERPLAVIIQSSSAAGKSSLMEAILAFVPEEDRVQYSAMTGQSLFYLGEKDLRHKILAIVEEEGAERASYALKLLQSEGELTIASTGKDPQSGRLVTHEYRVEGPVMILLTTTSIEIDEELLNRCLVLTVDESRDQTRAIHAAQRQRRTLEGLLSRRKKDRVLVTHQHAQRLLRPLPVVNPWAPQLTFLDAQTRTRRDHEKYLTLIETIALLHQYQRDRKEAIDERGQRFEYLEVTLQDLEVANRLASEVLGRTLDELPPQTRRFLVDLEGWVAGHCEALALDRCDFRFLRRQVADETDWSYFQVRKHLDRLVELEYALEHRSGRGSTLLYELLWDGTGADGSRFVGCLLDPEALDAAQKTPNPNGGLSPSEHGLSSKGSRSEPPLSPDCAPVLPPLSPRLNGRKPARNGAPPALAASPAPETTTGEKPSSESHSHA